MCQDTDAPIPTDEQIQEHLTESHHAETVVVDCPYCDADVETPNNPSGIDVCPCDACTARQVQQSDVL